MGEVAEPGLFLPTPEPVAQLLIDSMLILPYLNNT